MAGDLRDLDSFGDVAAEDDAVLLSYFVATDAVEQVGRGQKFLVLGRKGTGKTALVRHFTEGANAATSRLANLRGYPWSVHAGRVDLGASEIEAYVASWKYLIAVELASLVISLPQAVASLETQRLRRYLEDNYGGPRPTLAEILRPARLIFGKASFTPSVMGNSLGGVDLERKKGNNRLGLELDAITKALLSSVVAVATESRIDQLSIHFDELDQGLSKLDFSRMRMFIGLILAAREVRRDGSALGRQVLNPVVYLRSDIWDDLDFSDKNKINQTSTLHLEWNLDSLKELIDGRIRAKLGGEVEWADIASPALMRGSQPKWNHIVARTFDRPRDVISFCNSALALAKKRKEVPLVLENPDIIDSRTAYSRNLKRELDDEVIPHWAQWEEALQACSAISTSTFDRAEFEPQYESRRSPENQVSTAEALALLYGFSVIGYETRSGYGGSGWTFQYSDPDSGWDNGATKFKVHPGLKEFAKLREARAAGADDDW